MLNSMLNRWRIRQQNTLSLCSPVPASIGRLQGKEPEERKRGRCICAQPMVEGSISIE